MSNIWNTSSLSGGRELPVKVSVNFDGKFSTLIQCGFLPDLWLTHDDDDEDGVATIDKDYCSL